MGHARCRWSVAVGRRILVTPRHDSLSATCAARRGRKTNPGRGVLKLVAGKLRDPILQSSCMPLRHHGGHRHAVQPEIFGREIPPQTRTLRTKPPPTGLRDAIPTGGLQGGGDELVSSPVSWSRSAAFLF